VIGGPMVKSKGSSRIGRATYAVLGIYDALLVWLVLLSILLIVNS
jgi:hypothetical protein